MVGFYASRWSSWTRGGCCQAPGFVERSALFFFKKRCHVRGATNRHAHFHYITWWSRFASILLLSVNTALQGIIAFRVKLVIVDVLCFNFSFNRSKINTGIVRLGQTSSDPPGGRPPDPTLGTTKITSRATVCDSIQREPKDAPVSGTEPAWRRGARTEHTARCLI